MVAAEVGGAGGATGLRNILVDSPGSDDGVGAGGVVAAEVGGAGGGTGLRNILVDSPGSDDDVGAGD